MPQSYQGHFLIATPQMDDPHFSETVILMVQHDPMGALGVILNRPLGIPVSDVWSKISEVPAQNQGQLYQGGPCESMLMALTTHPDQGQIQIMSNLFYSSDPDHLGDLIQSPELEAQFFIGYAGWGPMQLESEIDSGSWFAHAAQSNQIFNPPISLYEDLLKLSDPVSKIMKQHYRRNLPEDPHMN